MSGKIFNSIAAAGALASGIGLGNAVSDHFLRKNDTSNDNAKIVQTVNKDDEEDLAPDGKPRLKSIFKDNDYRPLNSIFDGEPGMHRPLRSIFDSEEENIPKREFKKTSEKTSGSFDDSKNPLKLTDKKDIYNYVKDTIDALPETKIGKADLDKILFVARVLYSEASPKVSKNECQLVAKVILNRVNDPNFGKVLNDKGKSVANRDVYEVVNSKNAFSCINDSKNKNWKDYKWDLNERATLATYYAILMYSFSYDTSYLGDADSFNDIKYYHDKRLKNPPSDWTNRYFKPVLVKKTTNFKFYKVEPNK